MLVSMGQFASIARNFGFPAGVRRSYLHNWRIFFLTNIGTGIYLARK
jgi:hypothetical protein